MASGFDRVGYIKVLPYGSSKWLTFKGLDFQFDISKPIGAVCMDAKISILGLSMDNIKAISTWAAEAVAYAKPTRIMVFAGYANTSVNCIFDGSVIYAMPTMPPDVWLHIQARSGYYRCAQIKSGDVSKTEATLKPLAGWAEDMCAFIDVECDTSAIKDVTGDITFKAYTDCVTYQQVVYDIKKECDGHNVFIVETIDNNGKSKFTFMTRYSGISGTPKKISKNTGMIGVPRISWNEIEVTTLLDTSAEGLRGNFIDVYSRFAMPGMFNAKGERDINRGDSLYHFVYRVNNVRYHGHLRGQDWYVTYKAWRNFDKADANLKG